MKKIKAVIFDLGGVLYRIDHSLTRSAFARLGTAPEFSLTEQHDLFDKYDRGTTETPDFLNELRSVFGLRGDDTELIEAWNAMLLGAIADNIALAVKLREKMPIYLLSNINDLHYRAIKSELDTAFNQFDGLFMSYRIGMRKPDAEIYASVLNHIRYAADEILFIDDAPQNITAASLQGIVTQQLDTPELLPPIIKKLLSGN
ncbi:MAG: HAD family phosphatase [Bacteroidetes bacterium]|nr:HAD family phosphatase [Bacteroidota bacterium]